jgi:hypothetical protein
MNTFNISGQVLSVDLKNVILFQDGQKVPVRIPTNLILDLQSAKKTGTKIELKGKILSSFLPLGGVSVSRVELVAENFSVIN